LREVEHPVTSCKETKEYYPETPPPPTGGWAYYSYSWTSVQGPPPSCRRRWI
jgi:hypothetical protein